MDDEELKKAVRSRGYQPARADADRLFALLASGDRDQAELAERALARLPEAWELAQQRFPDSTPPLRGRLTRLIGRIASQVRISQVSISGVRISQVSISPVRFLLERLEDEDAKTRRNAIIALGKLDDPEVEAALLARWPLEMQVEMRRSLAASLGKVGGAPARALLEGVATDDGELRRIVDEALLKLRRGESRRAPGQIDARAAAAAPLPVRLHCRSGLSELVAEELDRELRPRVVDATQVEASLVGPLERLWQSRIALRFGFPLPTGGARDPGDAVVQALISDEAARIFAAFTRGPVRYRIEWSEAGHRRGLTYRVAQAVSARRPELMNDPTESLWELIVREAGGLTVELWPRGLPDPRFAYRQAHVPASSHPTLAAALARVGGARQDDVVWDPFVGAATELIERARLGPSRRLIGTDVDGRALDRARDNLRAAGVDAELVLADARTFRPRERPTLILTNPPMGRRVLNKTETSALTLAMLSHAATLLPPGGRIAWITPRADDAVTRARELGLTVDLRRRVDMGGFTAELQKLTVPRRR
jgi:23S rRNA G2445 N2-methylase RlmL